MSSYISTTSGNEKINISAAEDKTAFTKSLPAVQMMREEEELVQGKFDTVQKMGPE